MEQIYSGGFTVKDRKGGNIQASTMSVSELNCAK
jgi:hypothetical protein